MTTFILLLYRKVSENVLNKLPSLIIRDDVYEDIRYKSATSK